MKTWIRRVSIVCLALVALAGALMLYAGWLTRQTLAQRWELPALELTRSSEPDAVARGAHLAQTIGCAGCHGSTLGGALVVDAGPVMQVYAPNLTRGGTLPALDLADFEHAVRHAVGADGRPLLLMPARDYMLLSNADIGALYAYLQSLPPQPGNQPPSRIGPVGQLLHLAGMLPLTDATRIDHAQASRGAAAPPLDDALAHGRYLAQVCTGCHGTGLSGGPAAGLPPDVPTPGNLTSHETGLARWSETDFRAFMRTGKRPDGRAVDDFMPWRSLGQMSDAELHAIWTYLRSLPARPVGG